MAGNAKKPTKAACEARPTVISDDVFAGRSFWQVSSDVQEMPKGDQRYRVTHSAKFYVVHLMGTWLAVSESAERTVQYRNRLRWVRFENRDYQLRKAASFKAFMGRFIQGGCYAYVGGKHVDTEKELNLLIPQDFIYIAPSESMRIFNELRKRKMEERWR
jgi:hypothetical protein